MTTVHTGIQSALKSDFAAIFGRAYETDGWSPLSVFDGMDEGTGFQDAGIAAPAEWSASAIVSVGSGVCDIGLHALRYRYAHRRTQYPSNPNLPVEVDLASATSRFTLSNIVPSPDPKVDIIVVEMTKAGGSEFYRATNLQNVSASILISISDATLDGQVLDWSDFGHDVPPYFKRIAAFRGRLWGLAQHIHETGQLRIQSGGSNNVIVSASGCKLTSAAVGRMLIRSGDIPRFIKSVIDSNNCILQSADGIDSASVNSNVANYKIVHPSPDTLFYSKAVYVEAWPLRNQLRVLEGKPEQAIAHMGFRQDLVIFGQRAMELLVFVNDPRDDGRLEEVEGERGAVNADVIVNARGALWVLDYKGVHRWTGGIASEPEHMSGPLDPLFTDGLTSIMGKIDFAYKDLFHAVHHPRLSQILFFVVINGSPNDTRSYTRPQHCLVYDYELKRWHIWRFDVAMMASTLQPAANGGFDTLVADEKGYVWVLGIGRMDGVPAANPVSMTIASGATSVQLKPGSGETLYEALSGLAGAPVYWREGDAVGVIDSNDGSTINLKSGLGSTPAAGDTLDFGRIVGRWKSPAHVLETGKELPTWRYLHLRFEPRDTGEARVYVYLNRAVAAYAAWSTAEDQAVSTTSGLDYVTVDLTHADGYARIKLPSERAVTMEFEVQPVGAGTKMLVLDYEIDGYSEEEDQEI